MIFTPQSSKLWTKIGCAQTLALTLAEIMRTNDKVVLCTADMYKTVSAGAFTKEFAERTINTGIAEQSLIGTAAGLALEGFKPFALAHAAFVTARALDFVRVNLGYMRLPVILVGFACGYGVGYMGATHYACDDIAQIRAIPGITILSPADPAETMKMTEAAVLSNEPVYIRLPGITNNQSVYTEDFDFKIGKAKMLREGAVIAIIATGPQVARSLKVAELLEGDGLTVKVINMHTIRPLDTEAIDACLTAKLLVTAEEHGVVGGLGSAVAEHLALRRNKPPHLLIGTPNEYIGADTYEAQCKMAGLDAQSMAEKIMAQQAVRND